MIAGRQLLDKSRVFKHSGATLETLKQVIDATARPASTALQLYRWLVFNLLIANDDCHLKNLSFFVTARGIALAPHYDLLATGAYHTKAFADEAATWPDSPMAISLPGAGAFGQVNRAAVIAAGLELGIASGTAHRILDQMLNGTQSALDIAQVALNEAHAHLPDAARINVMAEQRFLRVMNHIVVKDMVKRLSH